MDSFDLYLTFCFLFLFVLCVDHLNEGGVVDDGDELDGDTVSIGDVRKRRDWIDDDETRFVVFFVGIFIPYYK